MAEYDHHGNEIPAPGFTKQELWAMKKSGIDIRQYKQVQDWLAANARDRQDAQYSPNYWNDHKPYNELGWDDPARLDPDDALGDPEWHKREVPEILP